MKQEMNDGITGVHPFTGMDYRTPVFCFVLFFLPFIATPNHKSV